MGAIGVWRSTVGSSDDLARVERRDVTQTDAARPIPERLKIERERADKVASQLRPLSALRGTPSAYRCANDRAGFSLCRASVRHLPSLVPT